MSTDASGRQPKDQRRVERFSDQDIRRRKKPRLISAVPFATQTTRQEDRLGQTIMRCSYQRSASRPFCLTTCSNFSAAPVGWRSPRSHWLTVATATFMKAASTA